MSTIYWILAITVMVVLLISSVYNLVTTIKSERAFKKSMDTFNPKFNIGDRVMVKSLCPEGKGIITHKNNCGNHIHFDDSMFIDTEYRDDEIILIKRNGDK